MNRREWITVAMLVVLVYAAIAQLVFRFRHPEMTDTQLMLHLIDALLWRTL